MRPTVEVYPVAPVGVQHPDYVNTHGAHRAFAEEGEHVESPGKAKSPLSKVKHKARKLKDKLKQVTGSNATSSPHDHGDLADDQNRDHAFPPHPPEYQQDDEEEDEEDEHIVLGDDQSKYEQMRSTGAMDKPGDGSEVHGGVPASVLAGTPNNSAGGQHNAPISPYKTAGPPGALQAAPTEYHYTPAEDEKMFKGVHGNDSLEQPKSSYLGEGPHISHNAAFDDVPYASHTEGPEDSSLEASSVAMPPSAGMKMAAESSDPPSSNEHSQKAPASSESPRFDMNVSYTDDIVKPNPEFGHSSSPTHNKIAIINEDLPAESRQDVRLAPKDYGGQQNLWDKSVSENVPLRFEVDESGVAGIPTPANVGENSASDVGQRFDNSEQEELKSRASDVGKRFDNSEQEEYKSRPSDDGRGETPVISAIMGEKERKDNESLVSEKAFKTFETDDYTDRHSSSGTIERPSFADDTSTPSAVVARDSDLQDGEEDNGKQATAGVGSFRTVESEKPLLPAIEDETREYRKHGENEGHLGVSNDDGSGLPSHSQSQLGTDAIAKLPVSLNMSNDDGKLPFTQSVQPESNDQESWGKWSADKLNRAKDPVNYSLKGSESERTAEEVPVPPTTKQDSETPLVTSVGNGKGTRNEGNEMESNVASEAAPTAGSIAGIGVDKTESPHIHERIHPPATVKEDEFYDPIKEKDDVEYYDPNNDDNNQFQEGFALGTGKAEEEGLNDTLAGSPDTTATKLGLNSSTHPETPSTENANATGREEDVSREDVSRPQVGSEKSGQTGVVQGLKDTVTSALGYGEVTSSKPSNEHGTEVQPSLPVADKQASFSSSQQQTGGTLQGLKNVLASKLGYGAYEKPAANEQTMYDESLEHANAENVGNTSINVEEKGEGIPSQKVAGGGALQGLRNAVASKLGYSAAADNSIEGTQDVSHDKGPAFLPVVEQDIGG